MMSEKGVVGLKSRKTSVWQVKIFCGILGFNVVILQNNRYTRLVLIS